MVRDYGRCMEEWAVESNIESFKREMYISRGEVESRRKRTSVGIRKVTRSLIWWWRGGELAGGQCFWGSRGSRL